MSKSNLILVIAIIIIIILGVSLYANYSYIEQLKMANKEISNTKQQYDSLKLTNNEDVKKNSDNNSNMTSSATLSICGFNIGMSEAEYYNLVTKYKQDGKMSIWDGNIYYIYWFSSEISPSYFQQFSIIFDKTPLFKDNQLSYLSLLIEPLFDDNNNQSMIINYLSNQIKQRPIVNNDLLSWQLKDSKITISPVKIRSKYYDSYSIYYRLIIQKE